MGQCKNWITENWNNPSGRNAMWFSSYSTYCSYGAVVTAVAVGVLK